MFSRLKSFFNGITGTSIAFLIGAGLLFVFSLFCEMSVYSESSMSVEIIHAQTDFADSKLSNPALKFYVSYFVYIWYWTIFLTFCGAFKSFARSFQSTDHLITQLGIATAMSLAFLVSSLIIISRQPQADSGLYNIVIGVFSVMSVCIGWLINTQVSRRYEEKNEKISKRNYKRTHTINVIIQLRLSEDLQKKVEEIACCYSLMATKIPRLDVENYFKRTAGDSQALSDDKYKAFSASLFILDIYEFICEGVDQDDLDEEVIYESLFGSMLRNRDRCAELIDAIRKGTFNDRPTPKALIQLVKFTDKHRLKYEQERSTLMASLN